MLTFEPTFVDSEDMYYASLMFDDCCTLDASEDLKKRRDRIDTADKAETVVFATEDEEDRKRKREEAAAGTEAPGTGSNMEAAHAFVAPAPRTTASAEPTSKPPTKKAKETTLSAMLDAAPAKPKKTT
jgi:hypothetical protein